MSELKLYSYFRSSSAYRVRIALNIKDLDYTYVPVHLLNDGGEQHFESHQAINPMRQVPCLIHNDFVINQSMSIIQYLDKVWPEPQLFSSEAYKNSQIMELCEIVNSGIQPIQNLNVMQELTIRFEANQEQKANWSHHWIQKGFVALEQKLKSTSGSYSLEDEVTAADLFLVPQVYNAHRFKVDMSSFPLIAKVNENCLKLEAFQQAVPEVQPDTPEELNNM